MEKKVRHEEELERKKEKHCFSPHDTQRGVMLGEIKGLV